MPTLIHHYDSRLPPSELDRYLTSGWRPAGQAVYTADYLRTDENELYGCIQVRLPLADFTFKKRHRKLLRRNDSRFRVTYEKAVEPDEEILELNRRYMVLHPDKTREHLEIHVSGEYGKQALDTRIVRVYEGEKLVAFSYFDVGERAAYSKAGIYDPGYAKFSLGIYTMLLEINWLTDQGYAYYHPGYVVPGYSLFDYKLQFGAMQYRQLLTGKWLTFDPKQPEDPFNICLEALEKLQKMLPDGHRELYEYPSFTARYHHSEAAAELLDAALLLQVFSSIFGNRYIVIFNPHQLRYELLETKESHLRDLSLHSENSGGRRRVIVPLVVNKLIVSSAKAEEIAAVVRNMFGSLS